MADNPTTDTTDSQAEASLPSRINKFANSPYPAWALSALCVATIPAAFKAVPGVPSYIQSIAFGTIFAGSGYANIYIYIYLCALPHVFTRNHPSTPRYVTSTGDVDNGAGITTAWTLTWSFLNLRPAVTSARPLPLLLATTVLGNMAIYGKKTLENEKKVLVM
ncbi:hypothetical protein BC937DRAFT_92940 [Endogone sp. FLAS-F59071]|nr:hypothetical protein BC937DRAFT_92940 [Endogone sp. FLAS-F59071]|eukprot:RUS21351.1 hypothetical protein BC937DRAFT_92940 [Endogone sp. FLAS-F59071]